MHNFMKRTFNLKTISKKNNEKILNYVTSDNNNIRFKITRDIFLED